MKNILLGMAISAFMIGCGGTSTDANDTTKKDNNQSENIYKPTKDVKWQWQLSGTVDTSYNVDLYDIDLFDTDVTLIKKLHNEGKKVICYFSAGSYEDWRSDKGDFDNSLLGNDLDG